MSVGHTPGPWAVGEYSGHAECDFTIDEHRPDQATVAVLAHIVDQADAAIGTTKANARLIAAAPELLAALESGLFMFEYAKDSTPEAAKRHAAALAAIAKAQGAREVKTAELKGDALDWARWQPKTDQPKTFGCHHNGPVCRGCEAMVRRWLVAELGDTVQVPSELSNTPT